MNKKEILDGLEALFANDESIEIQKGSDSISFSPSFRAGCPDLL